MAGRPKIFDEQDVIDKATEVFWAKGYEAASAEELLYAMNIGKGSFYHSFAGGKKELYEKSLDQYAQRSIDRFKDNLAKAEDAVDYLKDFFFSVSNTNKARQQNGCYLGNAIVEMSNLDAATQDKAVGLLSALEKQFAAIIRQAQKQGRIKTQEKPATVARLLINVWNGLNVTRRMYPAGAELRPLIALHLQILD